MTVSQTKKANAFRTLHEGPGAFVIPNPFDAGTARILAGLGFQALATTSAGCAFSLGRRDGAITRDEALAHARAIALATPLPVSADLENGFGDAPEAAALTVRLAAEAGLVGCSIEDASGDPARPIYEFSHAVERVAAAVEAARSRHSPSRSPRAPRTSCTAGPISTTRSRASRPSRRPAPTCSMRRGRARSSRSGRSAPPSAGR